MTPVETRDTSMRYSAENSLILKNDFDYVGIILSPYYLGINQSF